MQPVEMFTVRDIGWRRDTEAPAASRSTTLSLRPGLAPIQGRLQFPISPRFTPWASSFQAGSVSSTQRAPAFILGLCCIGDAHRPFHCPQGTISTCSRWTC